MPNKPKFSLALSELFQHGAVHKSITKAGYPVLPHVSSPAKTKLAADNIHPIVENRSACLLKKPSEVTNSFEEQYEKKFGLRKMHNNRITKKKSGI